MIAGMHGLPQLLEDRMGPPGSKLRNRVVDAAVALFVAGVSCTLIPVIGETGLITNSLGNCAVAVAAAATLMVRRTRPNLCVAAALLATFASDDLTPLLAAVYSISQYGGRFRHVTVFGAGLLYLVSRAVIGTAGNTVQELCYAMAVNIVLPALMGNLLRKERSLRKLLRERLDQAEVTVGNAVRFAALEQRTRMAYDIHDSVGHQLSVLVLHTGALQQLKDLPPKGREIADQLSDTAIAVMSEVRSVIGVLHDPENAESVKARQLSSTTFLPGLLRNMTAAGMDVSYQVQGVQRELPPVVDRMLYRLSREAMTNVAKHAPEARVEVLLEFTDTTVALMVENGPSAAHTSALGSGRLGLAGLREAVTEMGGQFEARELPSGGFLLHAILLCSIPGDAPDSSRRISGPPADEVSSTSATTKFPVKDFPCP
ncbi:sensor histidine kinase [Streptomyces pathocidini]|uniref:histidine kinase n=1 Tax=Streptomyces pathocidini TaxID=1650571 RepID=A0ABW7UUZ7_9ACTN|nr:histidine kinase [Streptomyces pathocidini]